MIKCTFEDGGTASLRHTTVDGLVLNEAGDQILLVKRATSLLEGGKWGDVGGYMERDETLVQCLEREVLEETGYRVHSIRLLTIRDNPDRPAEDRQNLAFVFVCVAGEQVGQPDDESETIKWFNLSQLPADEQIAFDHAANFKLYLETRADHRQLPVLNF